MPSLINAVQQCLEIICYTNPQLLYFTLQQQAHDTSLIGEPYTSPSRKAIQYTVVDHMKYLMKITQYTHSIEICKFI